MTNRHVAGQWSAVALETMAANRVGVTVANPRQTAIAYGVAQ